jgi:hypothetical protein
MEMSSAAYAPINPTDLENFKGRGRTEAGASAHRPASGATRKAGCGGIVVHRSHPASGIRAFYLQNVRSYSGGTRI